MWCGLPLLLTLLASAGNYNPLERVIKAASNDSNYSWCTCSEEICTEQLRGFVQWNMNGQGWKGESFGMRDAPMDQWRVCRTLALTAKHADYIIVLQATCRLLAGQAARVMVSALPASEPCRIWDRTKRSYYTMF